MLEGSRGRIADYSIKAWTNIHSFSFHVIYYNLIMTLKGEKWLSLIAYQWNMPECYAYVGSCLPYSTDFVKSYLINWIKEKNWVKQKSASITLIHTHKDLHLSVCVCTYMYMYIYVSVCFIYVIFMLYICFHHYWYRQGFAILFKFWSGQEMHFKTLYH